MIQPIVLAVHIVVAIVIIALILLQRGKGAEAGTGFGAGASGTVFGAQGSASFMTRATAVLTTLFFITSLALAFVSDGPKAPTSLLDRVPAPGQVTQPSTTGAESPNVQPGSAAVTMGSTPAEAADAGKAAGAEQASDASSAAKSADTDGGAAKTASSEKDGQGAQ